MASLGSELMPYLLAAKTHWDGARSDYPDGLQTARLKVIQSANHFKEFTSFSLCDNEQSASLNLIKIQFIAQPCFTIQDPAKTP